MKIEETQDGELFFKDPLSKGIVLFPENDKELYLINYLLTEEGKGKLTNFIKKETL